KKTLPRSYSICGSSMPRASWRTRSVFPRYGRIWRASRPFCGKRPRPRPRPVEDRRMKTRGIQKKIVGEVVSDRMEKTVVVAVRRLVKSPLYQKFVWKRARYKAHDEKNECKIGDRVLLTETRPLSREK